MTGEDRAERLERRQQARLLLALKAWRTRTIEGVSREELVAHLAAGRTDMAARLILRSAVENVEEVGGEGVEKTTASVAGVSPVSKALPFSAFVGRVAETIRASVRRDAPRGAAGGR